MEVKNEMTERRGVFYIEDQGQRIATMTYRFTAPNRLTIDHTVVNPGNEGKGLGKQLVQAGVDFAREHGYKIEPLCPYAKSVFDKTPDYGDVLA